MEVNEFKIRIQDEKHSWLTSCGKSEIWNDYSTTLMVNLLIQFVDLIVSLIVNKQKEKKNQVAVKKKTK